MFSHLLGEEKTVQVLLKADGVIYHPRKVGKKQTTKPS